MTGERWKVYYAPNLANPNVVVDEDVPNWQLRNVAQVYGAEYGEGSQAEDRARLIASAPELAEAVARLSAEKERAYTALEELVRTVSLGPSVERETAIAHASALLADVRDGKEA